MRGERWCSRETFATAGDVVIACRKSPPGKTYCYSETVHVQWQGGTIRSQLSVFPRPGGLLSEWATPPDVAFLGTRSTITFIDFDIASGELRGDSEDVEDCWFLRGADGTLEATIDLIDSSGNRPRLFDPRLNRAGVPMFERILYQFIGTARPYDRIDIQVRLTFNPPRKPAPLERSFWNDFLPGGRPESNRRKF